MPLLRLRRRPLIVTALATAALALAACSGPSVPPRPAPSAVSTTAAPTSARSPSPSPSPTPTPTPTPTDEPLVFSVAPTARLDAGVVATGAPVTVQGDGPAAVTFERSLSRIAATLDCSACTGEVSFNAPDRLLSDHFGGGTAPWSGTMLVDFGSPAVQEVWVDATGPWTLELFTHDDLPPTQGPVSGTGHAVVLMIDGTNSFDFACSPPPGQECQAWAYSFVRPGLIGGASSEIEETTSVDVELPGVIGIRTNGAWSITP